MCILLFLLFDLSFVAFPSVLWYCWLGLLTCKNRLPYNLYRVGGDVKHCTIQSNPSHMQSLCMLTCQYTSTIEHLKLLQAVCGDKSEANVNRHQPRSVLMRWVLAMTVNAAVESRCGLEHNHRQWNVGENIWTVQRNRTTWYHALHYKQHLTVHATAGLHRQSRQDSRECIVV